MIFLRRGVLALAFVALMAMVACTAKDSPFSDRDRGAKFSAKSPKDFPRQKFCVQDAKKLCGDVKPGKGRRNECLAKQMGKLSAKCKPFITVWSKKRAWREYRTTRNKTFGAKCGKDAAKLCKNVKNKRACVASNLKKVSKSCRTYTEASMYPCFLDRLKTCGAIKNDKACAAKMEKKKYSKACLARRKAAKDSRQKVVQACRTAMPKDCRGGKMMGCLKKGLSRFPADCQVAYIDARMKSG